MHAANLREHVGLYLVGRLTLAEVQAHLPSHIGLELTTIYLLNLSIPKFQTGEGTTQTTHVWSPPI